MKHSGNTVVELNDEAAEECRSRGAHFLKIVDAGPGEELVVWWWWPLSAGTALFSFKPCALIESMRPKELHVLFDDIPMQERSEWSERGSLLLRQLLGGTSVILINKNQEAVAMDVIQKIDLSGQVDINFARRCNINTNQNIYPFKSKVLQLTNEVLLVGRNCKQCRPPVNTRPKTPKSYRELQKRISTALYSMSGTCRKCCQLR